ncbi:hypothetical protein GTA08_BOTSDO07541 [Botryosphaeria dothidea]|uniref:Cell wall protein n=1 Tax=Botryosphaeria dothidea TaxID=55169 RepID=A0A8H4N5W9_9PEZI|nr:hypothetical protein GTA08_BOTSDO07541 [Botryosphaeria dothidea]
MQFKTLIVGAAIAATAAAAPTAASNKPFNLIAIQSGSVIHNLPISAEGGSLWVDHKTNASCSSGPAATDPTAASTTFFVTPESQGFFLYGKLPNENAKQQFFTDRSGMGRGVLGYRDVPVTGRNFELWGWTINGTHLNFDGQESFYACPVDDSYVVSLGLIDPEQKDCLSFAAHVVETDSPVGCYYN